jgi:threonine dehydratase
VKCGKQEKPLDLSDRKGAEKIKVEMGYFPHIKDISRARITINPVINATPLMQNLNLSELYDANVLLKREDLQVVRSTK